MALLNGIATCMHVEGCPASLQADGLLALLYTLSVSGSKTAIGPIFRLNVATS